jgi:hypothetical protein
MEKRFLGIVLSILGIAGLIFAAVHFINGGRSAHNIREIIGYGVIGIIFFIAGTGLVRSTRDRPS